MSSDWVEPPFDCQIQIANERRKMAGRSHSTTLMFAYCNWLLSSILGDVFESDTRTIKCPDFNQPNTNLKLFRPWLSPIAPINEVGRKYKTTIEIVALALLRNRPRR